jgi:hypothetical protein
MKVSEIFRSKYLKASDLQGKTIPVQIKSVEVEEVGEELEKKLVVYFKNNERGLVLNLTNATLLSSHFGDNTDGWIGRTAQLCSEPVMYQGRSVNGLRVKVPAPVAPGAGDLDDDINF